MELLDKGIMYESKIKDEKKSMIFLVFSSLVFLILGIVMGSILGGPMFSMMFMGFLVVACLSVISYSKISNYKSEINNIDEMTDVFDEFIITTQIISKAHESNVSISGDRKDIIGFTYNEYIVGLRTLSGQSFRVYSKNLYTSSREGEYVDVLVKQKLDKNKQVLDSSYIPLCDTIKQSI